MYNDVRQSPQFAHFMQDIGWHFEKVNSTYIYLRRFPFAGYFAKIPRPKLPINFDAIYSLVSKKKIFRLKIAPFISNKDKNYQYYQDQLLNNHWTVDQFPFNPTTTIHLDLQQSEQQLFDNCSPAKRRGVRRAIKNGIVVKESNHIDDFIKIRQKQYFPLGFLITREMHVLWKNFYPENASLLFAYSIRNQHRSQIQAIASICDGKPIAGILLLFYNRIVYYWYASSLKIGKKLFATTLLVWEAIKLAKKRGCTIFDFEGISDERFPKASQSWKGFTKFKEGFGGKKIVYMENFTR